MSLDERDAKDIQAAMDRMRAHREKVRQEGAETLARMKAYGAAFADLYSAILPFAEHCEHPFRHGCKWCVVVRAVAKARAVMNERDGT